MGKDEVLVAKLTYGQSITDACIGWEPRQLQHARVLGQHGGHQALRAALAQVVDQLVHQQLAQAAALEVAAHDDAELGVDVVGVDHRAHHGQRLSAPSGPGGWR
jgi:hypothetical protein